MALHSLMVEFSTQELLFAVAGQALARGEAETSELVFKIATAKTLVPDKESSEDVL